MCLNCLDKYVNKSIFPYKPFDFLWDIGRADPDQMAQNAVSDQCLH